MFSSVQAQEFRRICQETLGFVSAYGFSDGRLSAGPADHSTVVTFYGTTFAIECIWDDREEHLEIKIAKLRDGKPPTEFAVDAGGRCVRAHLKLILLRRGVRRFSFRKVAPGTPQADAWRIKLQDHAQLLQEEGQAVLRVEPDVLP
jgi:hypothetical protein